jgi:formylglycine-generating enzyme required for sulfatase activity
LDVSGLPDIVWCNVPAGEFIMGSDEFDDEKPPHKLTLPAFQISQYPITNAQFAAFVQDGGYTPRWRRCWTDAGWRWKGKRIEPYKRGGVFDLPNHPVVMVSWYEAAAFCNWLGEKLGCRVTLPTEAQWEKAASWEEVDKETRRQGDKETRRQEVGGRKRRYPWGDEITPDHANHDETGIGTTSAVGIFPKGRSPCGALDMSGNVWEWTCSLWGEDWQKPSFNYPYRADDGRENLEPGNEILRVVRGGCYGNDRDAVRCAARGRTYPAYGVDDSGFRVARSSP